MTTRRARISALALALWSTAAWAGGSLYVMRVDGLACPFCAYGIEQKLKNIEGVEDESIDVDFNRGLARVEVSEGTTLDDEQMRKLFNDAGVTFREMERKALNDRSSDH